MKKSTEFGRAFVSVISYPVYAVFCIVGIVYACIGHWMEALFLLIALFLSVCMRAYFLSDSAFPASGVPKGKKEKGTMEKLLRLSYRLSVIFALSAVPILLFAILFPTEGGISDALSAVLAVISLGLSVFNGAPGSPLEYTASLQLSRKKEGSAGYSVTGIDAAEQLAGCDRVVICNPLLLYDNTQQVRAVYYSGALYRGLSLAESSVKRPAEFCVLLRVCLEQQLPPDAPALILQREDALFTFATSRISDLHGLPFYADDRRPFFDTPEAGDVGVFLSGPQESRTVFRTVSADALSYCGFMRTAEGEARPLDDYVLRGLYDAVDEMRKENLIPFYVYTFPGNVIPEKRIGNGTLEAIFAVGGVCPASNGDAAEALEDFGITPMLVLPKENRTSLGFASVSGICSGLNRILTYSDTSLTAANGEKLAENARAFVGFPTEEMRGVLRLLNSHCSGICTVARQPEDLSLFPTAKATIAIENRSEETVERAADASVQPASLQRTDAGMPALFSLFTEACTAMCKMTILRNILLAYGAFLVVSCLIPLLCGVSALLPSAVQILLCATFTIFFAVLTISSDRVLMQSRMCLETDVKEIRRSCIRSAAIGLLTAAAAGVCGILAFSHDAQAASAFVFSALVTSAVSFTSALRLSERRRYGISGVNATAILTALIGLVFVLFLSFVRFPTALAGIFGFAEIPWKNALFSLIPAAVPFVFLLAEKWVRKISFR